uniref:ATP synthase F0 subunit 6 n=1 Tax=Alboglossiphonia lata TaxID=321034 RepID=UPI0023D811B1|nr:ATP synthase F0 subunit 6 [Alboglossiphonia lata]WDA96104.1 ATP synthase F0 subunit 6 [Alboglossiphonia lata]
MLDIFSSFDSYEFNSISIISNPIMITSMMILLALLFSPMWLSQSRVSTMMLSPINLMYNQLSRTQSKYLKGYTLTISMLFLVLIMINLMGMIPFSFSMSSQLMYTLALGLPLWMSLIISSMMKNKKEFMAKLLPDGAPDWLNPFLVLIETISISVRPLTLSFRLAANMSAGHIVLGLMGIYLSVAMNSSIFNTMMLLMISSSYIMFELAICLIQAYIFCLLLSLYSDDHTNL